MEHPFLPLLDKVCHLQSKQACPELGHSTSHEQDLFQKKDQRFTLNSSPCVLPEPKRIPLYIQDSLEDCTPPSELLMLSPTTCLNFFSKAAPANTLSCDPRMKQMKRVLHEASNAGFFKVKLKPQGLSFRNPYSGLETCQEGRA